MLQPPKWEGMLPFRKHGPKCIAGTYELRLRMNMLAAEAMAAAMHAATITCHGARTSPVFGTVELTFEDVELALVDAADCG